MQHDQCSHYRSTSSVDAASLSPQSSLSQPKDSHYWEKRRKNNEAAKRSREKRRVNDAVVESRLAELARENDALKMELDAMQTSSTSTSTAPPSLTQPLHITPTLLHQLYAQAINQAMIGTIGGSQISHLQQQLTPPALCADLAISTTSNSSSHSSTSSSMPPIRSQIMAQSPLLGSLLQQQQQQLSPAIDTSLKSCLSNLLVNLTNATSIQSTSDTGVNAPPNQRPAANSSTTSVSSEEHSDQSVMMISPASSSSGGGHHPRHDSSASNSDNDQRKDATIVTHTSSTKSTADTAVGDFDELNTDGSGGQLRYRERRERNNEAAKRYAHFPFSQTVSDAVRIDALCSSTASSVRNSWRRRTQD